MATSRTTFTLDHGLAERARALGINVSAAAREGVAEAVRVARTRADREAYLRQPEDEGTSWAELERWGEP